MSFKSKFSEADMQRISQAVKDAEDKISGEVVPVIVERSGTYTAANYKGALLAAAAGFALMIILDRYVLAGAGHVIFYDPLFLFVAVAAFGIIGGLLPSWVDPIKRALIGREQLDVAARQRAEIAFLEEQVFNTRQRTGILIFISFFEREVVVLADKGINSVLDQKEWDNLVQALISEIRQGRIVNGLEAAIRRCGEILLEKGFHKTADDINELGDDLRLNS